MMTAAPNWDIVGPSSSDAELASASAVGDRIAFAEIYDRYADRLHDFCVGMLADRDGAADCVQDVFCIAATHLPQLRDPDKLLAVLDRPQRGTAPDPRPAPRNTIRAAARNSLGRAGPGHAGCSSELSDLIADAAGGLSDRDRSVLELAFRHGLNGPDLAEALDVSPGTANTIVKRLRDTIERSLGALLVSRRVRNTGGCKELAAILAGWDGHFNVLMRKRISRHIESCDICDEERRRLVTPAALLGAAPVFIPAPQWLRERTLSEVQLTSAATPMDDTHSQPNDQGGRSFVLPVTAFIAALIVAVALILFWLNQNDVSITPTDATETVPASSAPPPPPTVAPPPPPTVKPTVPASTPPTRRAPVVETPPPPPVSEPPPPEVTSEVPPPPPPPWTPPPWPDWLPTWPPPPPPPPPPGGSNFTGPGGLVAPPLNPPPGSSVQP
jgi:DNA-directed RNA polymerase specialized sigma24 family protein